MGKARSREILVPGLILLALAFIGLIALLEKGPLQVTSAPGAYPGNTGPLGTSTLYQKLKENYTVFPVTSWGYIGQLLSPCNASVVAIIVSPEASYTDQDIEVMKYLRGSCNKFSLLIADESRFSNKILEGLGSSVRVEGSIMQPHYLWVRIETPWNWSGRLILDKASRLYTIPSPRSPTPIGFVEKLGGIVAYYDVANGVEFTVIGDGSIFLNQVLESSISSYYESFLKSTLSHLCGSTGECIVLLEASKYAGVDPVEALRGGDKRLLGLMNMVDLIIAAIAKIIHPSTWLPPLMNIIDYSIRGLIATSAYFKSLLIAVIAVLIALIAPRERRARDTPLSDVSEIHWYGFGEFRRRLVERGTKLSKEDFKALYNIVDTALKATTGSSIEDPQLASVLEPLGFNKVDVEKYREYMLKYYGRATGKTIWPPIVFWNRVIRKALIMSENILDVLGASLTKLSKLERIEERGLRSYGSS